jgi:hypothetical protein
MKKYYFHVIIENTDKCHIKRFESMELYKYLYE